MASLTIRPGSRVRLKGQADHVPDFLVIRCDRDRCWVRQQDWGPGAQLNVRFTQLLVSEPAPGIEARLRPFEVAMAPLPLDNVIYMDAYRRQKAR
ncbi:MAG TPA: hypothetical protein IGR64_14660 [Leptolyngbyaceae cyanobacterium M65_K2018_010]|nr:hypothetical protein [Leptolyngbyaceae cyanobacterium M65_K2018_010]